MLPVLLRHLLPHHPRIEARGIEDVGVVGAPQRIFGIVGRGIRTLGALARPQMFTIPLHAAIRGENGPAHPGEAAHEERRHAIDDVVVRF